MVFVLYMEPILETMMPNIKKIFLKMKECSESINHSAYSKILNSTCLYYKFLLVLKLRVYKIPSRHMPPMINSLLLIPCSKLEKKQSNFSSLDAFPINVFYVSSP